MASIDSGCEKKQETIRVLLDECRKGQMDIDAQLTKNLQRVDAGKIPECVPSPMPQNILNAFIEDLIWLSDAQKNTLQFINFELNSKLV
ncbi:MAG: hypothetical protein WC479_05920 [Candidatus Izemoplasmatales bacterium]